VGRALRKSFEATLGKGPPTRGWTEVVMPGSVRADIRGAIGKEDGAAARVRLHARLG